MVDKINDFTGSKALTTVSNANNDQKAEKSSTAQSTQTTSENSVQLSKSAQQLDSIKQIIDRTPDIDQKRVDEVKQALASGELKIDANALAKKMLEIESV